jgi:hypothetical protein
MDKSKWKSSDLPVHFQLNFLIADFSEVTVSEISSKISLLIEVIFDTMNIKENL